MSVYITEYTVYYLVGKSVSYLMKLVVDGFYTQDVCGSMNKQTNMITNTIFISQQWQFVEWNYFTM